MLDMDSGVVRQYNIAKMESEPTYIGELFHQMDIAREHCLPCIVTAYDASKNTVDVKPLANHTRDNGKEIEEIERPELKGIPLLRFAHGGFRISAPLFVGDTGYVIAGDRSCRKIIEGNSTELYADDADGKKNKGAGKPDDCSLTKFYNGFFVPCSWASAESTGGSLVIEGIGKSANDSKWQRMLFSNDGSITIEVADRKITIGKDGVVFDGKTEADLSLVTDIRYNDETHYLQAKHVDANRSGNTIVKVGDKGGWKDLTKIGSDSYPKEDFRFLKFNDGGRVETLGKIVAESDATILQRVLEEGQNISLSQVGDKIIISANRTPISAGAGIRLDSGVMSANVDGTTIETRIGSGNARTIQLLGANSPGSNLVSNSTFGQLLANEGSDPIASSYVPVLLNGAIRYVLFDQLNIQAAQHSGFNIQRGNNSSNRPCLFVNWAGRQNPSGTYSDIELRTVNIYAADGTVASSVEVPASAAFKIPAVKGGNGITVTSESDGAVQRVDAAVADVTAAAGSGIVATKDSSTGIVSLTLADNDTTSYYTDTGNGLRLCVGATYNPSTHKFTAQYLRFNVQAGRLLANPTSETEEVFVAVQES